MVTVIATDSFGAIWASIPVTITVTDINEGPEVTGTGPRWTMPRTALVSVATYTATDPENAGAVEWSLETGETGDDADELRDRRDQRRAHVRRGLPTMRCLVLTTDSEQRVLGDGDCHRRRRHSNYQGDGHRRPSPTWTRLRTVTLVAVGPVSRSCGDWLRIVDLDKVDGWRSGVAVVQVERARAAPTTP